MAKIDRGMVEICDHCISYFTKMKVKHVSFNYAKKEAIVRCSCCRGAMCLDCHTNSLRILNDSILAVYGFSICKACIVSVRKTTCMQEELERWLQLAIEEMKENMSKSIYSLTEKRQCQP